LSSTGESVAEEQRVVLRAGPLIISSKSGEVRNCVVVVGLLGCGRNHGVCTQGIRRNVVHRSTRDGSHDVVARTG